MLGRIQKVQSFRLLLFITTGLLLIPSSALADHLTWYHQPEAGKLPNWWEWRVDFEMQPWERQDDRILFLQNGDPGTIGIASADNGSTLWQTQLSDEMYYGTSWTDGRIYVGVSTADGKGRLVSLSEETGEILSQNVMAYRPIDSEVGFGFAYFVRETPQSSIIEAYRLDGFELVWTSEDNPSWPAFLNPFWGERPQPYGSMGSHLRLLEPEDGGHLIYVSNQWVVALNAASGQLAWKAACPGSGGAFSINSLSYAEGVLYVACDGLWALDAETGRPLWEEPKGGRVYSSHQVIVMNGSLIYHGLSGEGMSGLWVLSLDGLSAQFTEFDLRNPNSRLELDHNWGAYQTHMEGVVVLKGFARDVQTPSTLYGWNFRDSEVVWELAVDGYVMFAEPYKSGTLLATGMPYHFMGHQQLSYFVNPSLAAKTPVIDFGMVLHPTIHGANILASAYKLPESTNISQWHWQVSGFYGDGSRWFGAELDGPEISYPPGPGEYILTLLAIDEHGRSSLLSRSFVVDSPDTTPAFRETPGFTTITILLALAGHAFAVRRRFQQGANYVTSKDPQYPGRCRVTD